MRVRVFLVLLLIAVPRAFGQALPDLGDVSQATLRRRRSGAWAKASCGRFGRIDPTTTSPKPPTISPVSVTGWARAAPMRARNSIVLDRQINAFALPGGFIGVNVGLLLAAQSESEVAGVLAHEISHVTQRHIARMIAQQKQGAIATIATLAAATSSRVSSDAAQAAVAFGQAGAIQSQLNFTRDNEREADRFGLQLLEQAARSARDGVVLRAAAAGHAFL